MYYSAGKVGIGTSSPSRNLHVKGSAIDAILESTASNGSSYLYFGNDQGMVGAIGMGGSSYPYYGGANNLNILVKYGSSDTWTSAIIVNNSSGYVGLGTTSPSYPLHMASGAYVTSGGVWTNASSRDYKKDIHKLSSEDAMLAFNQLEPVSFKYKSDDEQHVGFIAEDVPDLVASGDRKGLSSMDMVAVLTKVVQDQQKTIATLSKKVKSLETKMKKSN
ncbi:MAG: tail fiber domain-containing protein [Nitrospirota bacterium]